MRITLPLVSTALTTLILAASACGGGGGSTGGGGGTSSSSSSGNGGMPGTGGATSSSSSTTSSTGDGGSPPMPGPFTSKDLGSSYEAQTTLAADGKGNLFAAWVAFSNNGMSSIGYAASHDDGVNWTYPQYASSPGGRLASNPVATADGQGKFYLAWLGFSAAGPDPDEHIYLASAGDGNFVPVPAVASDDGTSTKLDFDSPAIAVDASDNVLLAWADFSVPGAAALTFARTVDGQAFTRTTVANDATFGNLASLCVDRGSGPTAPLYMVHLAVGATVSLRRSDDAGKTWKLYPVPAQNVVFQNVSCAVFGPQVWITYGSGTAVSNGSTNPPADAVEVVHSGNGGSGFEQPVIVSTGAAGVQYLFPRVTFDPTGNLYVSYYEGVVDGPAKFQLATSPNGGAWGVKTQAMPGTLSIDRTIASWLGDYTGFALSQSGEAFATYTENTAGKAHIGLVKVSP